jgi:hypothetical protein
MSYRLDLAAGRKWYPIRAGLLLKNAIAAALTQPCARVVREDGLEVFTKGRAATARLVRFDGEVIR